MKKMTPRACTSCVDTQFSFHHHSSFFIDFIGISLYNLLQRLAVDTLDELQQQVNNLHQHHDNYGNSQSIPQCPHLTDYRSRKLNMVACDADSEQRGIDKKDLQSALQYERRQATRP
jgi:hypothetical protein